MMLRRCLYSANCLRWIGNINRMHVHTSAKMLFSKIDKDLPTPSTPTPLSKTYTHDTDILLDQLRKAKSLDRILELTSSHLTVMNAAHIVISLENVHALVRHNEVTSEELLRNPGFQNICSRLMKIIRLLEPDDLICVYKVLYNLGVRNNTYVMQSILKMIGGHLNDLSIAQLTFLNFLLSKQRHNTLVDGLRLALPLVLQVQIEQQLDSGNMAQMVDCLQLAVKSRLKPATIQKVLGAISDNAKSMTLLHTVNVIYALLHLDTPLDGYKELLNYCFNTVAKNLDLMDCKRVLPLLRICRTQRCYHERFFFAAADKIVREKWHLDFTWEATKYLRTLNFCPPNLMDHLTEVICNEAEVFITAPEHSPLTCVEFLTMTGHRPPYLNEALKVVCSAERKIRELADSPMLLIKFVSHLAMLGYFPRDLLSTVLNEDFMFSTWTFSKKLGRKENYEDSLLALAWSLENFNELNNYPFPRSVLKSLSLTVRETNVSHVSPLQKCMEHGLGGPQFVQNEITTENGIFIDHVIAMRTGNYPVAVSASESSLSTRVLFVEELLLPADAKIVAVIGAREENYCKDPAVLSSFMETKIKNLRKRNMFPVVINLSVWKELPDREKIPYLMQEIKQAVPTESGKNRKDYSETFNSFK